jgi:hypothetical protein
LPDVGNDNDLRFATLHDTSSIDFTYNFNIDHFTVASSIISSLPFLNHHPSNPVQSCTIGIIFRTTIQLRCRSTSIGLHLTAAHGNVLTKWSWHRVSTSDLASYQRLLKNTIDSLHIPMDAIISHNLMCDNASHTTALNAYSNALIRACSDSANCTILRTNRSNDHDQSNVLPGWKHYVAHKSTLRNEIWVDCGRPLDGIVAGITPRTMTSHHYAVRFVKNNSLDDYS